MRMQGETNGSAGGAGQLLDTLAALFAKNFDVFALFSSMETNFEAWSSPEPKMVQAWWKYIDSAWFGGVYGGGLVGDYFFPALVEYSNDIQNPTHV